MSVCPENGLSNLQTNRSKVDPVTKIHCYKPDGNIMCYSKTVNNNYVTEVQESLSNTNVCASKGSSESNLKNNIDARFFNFSERGQSVRKPFI